MQDNYRNLFACKFVLPNSARLAPFILSRQNFFPLIRMEILFFVWMWYFLHKYYTNITHRASACLASTAGVAQFPNETGGLGSKKTSSVRSVPNTVCARPEHPTWPNLFCWPRKDTMYTTKSAVADAAQEDVHNPNTSTQKNFQTFIWNYSLEKQRGVKNNDESGLPFDGKGKALGGRGSN